jgi:hypothetical protein
MKSSEKYRISEYFQQAIKTFCQEKNLPDYQFAAQQNISPTILSFILTRRMLFSLNDQRIERIAAAIGFKKSCFEVQAEYQPQVVHGGA